MSHTACILHGRIVLSVLSPPSVPSNASRSCEILSHTLTLLSQEGVDLRPLTINLQGDNCCKELKNTTLLRWLSLHISTHRVRSGCLIFLQSGHSHEDIDMHFSTISSWYARNKELHTMNAFRQCLQDFYESLHLNLNQGSMKIPLKLETNCLPRKNYLSEHFLHAHLRGIGGPGAPHVFQLDRRHVLETEGRSPPKD